MNSHIETKAAANEWAYFSLAALYDLPKAPLRMTDVLLSTAPFGSNISLDGVHPSAQGQSILATAAARAISAKYGVSIP
jgi:lysophospholipase L1-like esterase